MDGWITGWLDYWIVALGFHCVPQSSINPLIHQSIPQVPFERLSRLAVFEMPAVGIGMPGEILGKRLARERARQGQPQDADRWRAMAGVALVLGGHLDFPSRSSRSRNHQREWSFGELHKGSPIGLRRDEKFAGNLRRR